jgi:hypothetical protein
MARKAVLGQVTALVELGKANRNTAPDGGMAIHHALRTQVEALSPPSQPGQHMCTMVGHDHTIATRQLQFGGG